VTLHLSVKSVRIQHRRLNLKRQLQELIGIIMNKDKFIQAYNVLIRHLHETMGDTNYSAADALEIAKGKTSEAGSLTDEEVSKVSNYVTRDIDHAASNLESKSNASFSEWLKFDIDLIEDFALDAFMDLADKTRLELAIIEQQAKDYHPYHSGEITGPGTFMCEECGKEIAFKSTSQIPECPNCKAKIFVRS
jgi:rubrerythrin